MEPVRFHTSKNISTQQTVIEALQSSCALSKTELKLAMTSGAVWLERSKNKTKRLRKGSFELLPGDLISLYYDRALLRKTVDDPIKLVHHNNYSAWYKPPGMVTQGTKYGDHLSLLRLAERSLQLHNRLHLVHRLDREARGLVVLAHNKMSSAALSRQFKEKSIEKRYWARAQGVLFPEGETFKINRRLDNKESLTIVTNGAYSEKNNSTELFIDLKTGRYHQIRRHLAAINHPLVGDRRYGSAGRGISAELQLCAYQLKINEPGSHDRVSFTLPSSLMPFSF